MLTNGNVVSGMKFKFFLTQAFLLLFCLLLSHPLYSSSLNRAHLGQKQSSLVYSASQINNPKLTVSFENEPLESVLQAIAKKAEVGISYKKENLPKKSVTYKAKDSPVFEVLQGVLKGTHLYAALSGNREVIIIKKRNEPQQTQFQTGTITGRVYDAETGEQMPGVSVYLEGTTQGDATDKEGRYKITGVDPGEYTLIAQFIGYKNEKKQISVSADEIVKKDFRIISETSELDELVVVGYGAVKKKDLTGSVTSITASDIDQIKTETVDQALVGKMPGVFVSSASGEPGAGAIVHVRGLTSLRGDNQPLFVVDGVPIIKNPNYGGIGLGIFGESENPLLGINPDNIKRIDVLKDASAAAIYGARGANGVVLITTKKGNKGSRTKINLSIASTIQNPTKTYDLLDVWSCNKKVHNGLRQIMQLAV